MSSEEFANHVEGKEEEEKAPTSPCTTLVVREPEQSVEPRPDLAPATIEEIAALFAEHFGKAIAESFDRHNDSIKTIFDSSRESTGSELVSIKSTCGSIVSRVDAMQSRFDAMEHRISASFDRFGDAMDRRFDALDSRFDSIDKKLGRLADTLDDAACMTDRRDVKRARLGDL